jgi:hypothetical protein
MFKMFKGDARGVFAGACCAVVVMMCSGVSTVQGMDPLSESGKNGSSPELVAITAKMSDEEYAQAKSKIQELAELAVSDMEKMRELVEFLCNPRIDSGLAVFAHVCFVKCQATLDESSDWDEIIRRTRMLNDIMNRNGTKAPCSQFWAWYNGGLYDFIVDSCSHCSDDEG